MGLASLMPLDEAHYLQERIDKWNQLLLAMNFNDRLLIHN